MGEQWRPIPGHEAYEVSDQGRVRHGARILRCTPSRANEYRRTRFGRSGPEMYVHHAVLLVFVGPRPDGLEVRHLDGDPLNNTLQNLRYGTHVENMADQLQHGTNPRVNKTECPKGHPYDGDNLYQYPDGRRSCRICTRQTMRDWRARRAAAGLPRR